MKISNKTKYIPFALILIISLTLITINISGEKKMENEENESISFQNISSDNFNSSILKDLKRRTFSFPDPLISNSLKISSNGSVKWKALTSYPEGCGNNQAVQKIGDRLTCIDIGQASSTLSWVNLENYPAGCPSGQAIQAVGDTLTCIETGDASIWTDGGSISYLTSTSDNLAIGGTGSSAPLYFDNATDKLQVSSSQTGSATNNLSISSSGFLTLTGSATVYEDIRVPVTSTTRGGSKVPGFDLFKDNGSGSQGVFTYWFDSGSEEELYFTVQLPHDYKEGSDIFPHVHWTPKADGSAGTKVSWGLEYNWANREAVFGNTSIVYANTSSPNETPVKDKQYLTSFSTISGTGKTISSMLMCRIFRNASGAGSSTDDYASDAGLLEIDFHYEKDKLGSDDEF